eukprot:CAMPEP_0171771260 /NCGR_PEP_ID=MMETSP0991-20121206/53961_1 /TAXON_ID=483369 /ORGANISM="non described non described, Strain CCMP2098" /LENGTH=106 /DNA_ID=CAMNT_0012376511 /DNA_START=413 /DNA_END=733 /DNA_ORIENTATION=+
MPPRKRTSTRRKKRRGQSGRPALHLCESEGSIGVKPKRSSPERGCFEDLPRWFSMRKDVLVLPRHAKLEVGFERRNGARVPEAVCDCSHQPTGLNELLKAWHHIRK